ncbi:site-specific integrase [Alkalihalobacillus deserti]|uniref:site-specific integrase n=1 Tax=Alkalihalobacillus deserti TaxID=2879466 RepID=UPI001D1482C6|nr:site-specific integrase [Alkalihalobacillus deserti]
MRYILTLRIKYNCSHLGKKLEGLSSITLDNYLMELSMFADIVKKKAEDIATADVRMYLNQDGILKMSTIRKKLSVLKIFLVG